MCSLGSRSLQLVRVELAKVCGKCPPGGQLACARWFMLTGPRSLRIVENGT